MPIKVDVDRCRQDHRCPTVAICPEKALSQKGFRAPNIDGEKCTSCMECTFFCPGGVFAYEETYIDKITHIKKGVEHHERKGS